MNLQLLSTFQQYAAAHEEESPAEGVSVIKREIQWQLAGAFINLMEYHGIESGLKLLFQKSTLYAPTVICDLVTTAHELDPGEKTDLYRKTTFFLEELQSFDESKTLNVRYHDVKRPARIVYGPKHLYAALTDMRDHKFPSDLYAIRHLNLAAHLLERAEEYLPAHKLH